jgi:hypothetical protein
MRYQNWDVLLFPGNSRIPIQEFNTACHVVADQGNQSRAHLAVADVLLTKFSKPCGIEVELIAGSLLDYQL